MTLSILFLVMFVSFSVLLLPCMSWVLQSSREAERMFALVKSTREDRRKIRSIERFANLLTLLTRRLRPNREGGAQSKTVKRLLEAGYRSQYAGELFLWFQGGIAIAGAVVGGLMSSSPYLWAVIGGAVGYMLPDFWLGKRQRQRQGLLRRAVPDMVDLLVICVGAGLGLDQALLRVAAELKLSHPPLSEELDRVLLERGVGASRVDAWRAMAKRVHLEEIDAFVSMLAETDRFGSPIVSALSQFSDELRAKRRQHAEEAAAKTKVKIIFPLVLCIFPCIFLVLLVPAMLGFFHNFSSMSR